MARRYQADALIDTDPASRHSKNMLWAVATMLLVFPVFGYLLATVRKISRCRDELGVYALSIRFWLAVVVIGVAVVVLFASRVWGQATLGSEVWRLTLVLLAVLPAVVISAGVYNAAALWRSLLRRRRALACGVEARGRVVQRRRGFSAHDLMTVVLDVDVPEPSVELMYRLRDPRPARRVRLRETCSADHWERFEPGADVAVHVMPGQPSVFALSLFG